ncbi:MAG TPA: hypothetical protein DC000_02730 [Clostridiales bacterium]|nr:hypothetical protein [Clostridiales bacterium]
MNQVTRETRLESYLSTGHETRYKEILNVLKNKKMTAREVAYALGYVELNAVRPRLTELEQKGIVEIIGKVKDEISERSVAIYKIVV